MGRVSALNDFLDGCQTDGLELHSLIVEVDRQRIAEGYAAPYERTDTPLVYSLSKSFMATAVGFAIDEGLFSLEDKVLDLLPAYRDLDLSPAWRDATMHHLLSMSTGHTEDTLATLLEPGSSDPIASLLRCAPQRPLGSVHVYNNGVSFLAGYILQKLSGERLVDYLRPRLFDPLGIGPVSWDQGGTGVDLGFSGLHISTDGLARFARLYLDDGVWEGHRLLPAGWVATAARHHIETGIIEERPLDWSQGYGYQFWMARHGYRGDGACGQFVIVLPKQRASVAITGLTENMQGVLDRLWTHLLPSLAEDRSGGGLADAELHERLDAWQLPAPTDGEPVEETSVLDGGIEHRLATGFGEYRRQELSYAGGHTVPVAVAAVRRGGRIRGRMYVLSTPHSAELTGDADGRAALSWNLPRPLDPVVSLADLTAG